VALHPAEHGEGDDEAERALRSELYLMCEDVDKTIQELSARGVECKPVSEQPWGRVTRIVMPSGGELGLYQPLHPTALDL
ncbi:MAG: extradiol dioxygenase, partial [Gemmatimonadales bacterium]